MLNVSVQNLSRFEIVDETGDRYCGGWQEWYGRGWKRVAGCGPTVISGIIHYLLETAHGEAGSTPMTKSDFQALMEDVWHYVTPSVRGLPSAAVLSRARRLIWTPKASRMRPRSWISPKPSGCVRIFRRPYRLSRMRWHRIRRWHF